MNEEKNWKEEYEKMREAYGAVFVKMQKMYGEIAYWKEMFEKAMEIQENIIKPAKYTDEWWKEVEEFNKQLKAQENVRD
jgi:hypothetical protein